MEKRIKAYCEMLEEIVKNNKTPETINKDLMSATKLIEIDKVDVADRVKISDYTLKLLSKEQRKELAKALIEEQVINQRSLLSHWSTITAQSSMIDTGYIAQHLVSLQTQIAGQGMRGKGEDLCDGAEVKGANFLDSLDKAGATAPRWNFTAVTKDIMERFLEYTAIYLLSIDYNPENNFRIRIWKVNIKKHTILKDRYVEWMKKLGYPKFADTTKKPSVNFQLFPPNSGTDQNYARHGNGRANGFDKLQIPLEGTPGSELIFKAEIVNNEVIISQF
ncbi:MamI family restriction endonuclease [Tyzzerella nexilis]|nr:MamI family restriction endonuclease [[Clostridium] nexile]MCB7555819.1 MamI family restriction endonuclease [[Clostridium] nexile]NSD84717.1 MamI family restriction endonuclease [[Clostridium] nexile]NSD87171.1 MamI family restriction endonuclease [[Clostridium] nexile]